MHAGFHQPTGIKTIFFEKVSPIWQLYAVFGRFSEIFGGQRVARCWRLQKMARSQVLVYARAREVGGQAKSARSSLHVASRCARQH
jgi:hypothetical protein